MNAFNQCTFQSLNRRSISKYGSTRLKTLGNYVSWHGLFPSFTFIRLDKNGNRKRQRFLRFFSSVSGKEVSKFSELSKTWWEPQQNPLIGMNSIRVEYIVNQLRKIPTSADENSFIHDPRHVVEGLSHLSHEVPPELSALKALDVGCGGGLLSESLSRLGAEVVAVDPSHNLVEHAKKHAGIDPRTRSIEYRGGYTIEQLAEELSDDCFDIICILEVVEHVTDVESILRAAKSLLKPNTGRLFLSTINRTLKSHIFTIIGAEYVMGYLPPGTHNWKQFRSPREVEELMNRVGLQQIDFQGMVITKPPFQGHWNWKLDEMDTDVNWIGSYKIT